MGFSQNNLLWQAIFHTMRLRMFLSPPPLFLLPQKTLCFLKNTTDNQIKTTNTIDSGQTISSLYYSAVFDKTLVGYDGLIVVINEADGAMLKVVDIINKQLPANRKSESFYGI
jgi:hypothetical protein